MIDRLYIIGNGFDLHHGINSSYYQYCQWLQSYHKDIYDNLVEIFGTDDEWWGNFEMNLGDIDLKEMIDEWVVDNYPNYLSDDFRDSEYHDAQIEAEVQLTSLISQIKDTFSEWIGSLNDPLLSEKVDILNDNSIFINFNYTPTLETAYHVHGDKICYIHGKSGAGRDLILGHGKDEDALRRMVDCTIPAPENLDPDEQREWMESQCDVIKQWTQATAVHEYVKLYKDCNAIIDKNNGFFGQLTNDIKNIYIFGLSFSDVDMPYIKHILQLTHSSDPEWTVSYYSDSDENIFRRKLIDVGVAENKINMIKLSDIMLRNIYQQSLPLDEE